MVVGLTLSASKEPFFSWFLEMIGNGLEVCWFVMVRVRVCLGRALVPERVEVDDFFFQSLFVKGIHRRI